jgi:hypothetical protein
MRRVFTLAVRAALAAAVVGAVRALLRGRTPDQALHGTQPVVGSLDTWPQVPRRSTD